MPWSLPIRLVVAGVSGSVLALAFEPTAWWWLLSPAVAGLTLACTGATPTRSGLVGLVGGLGFFLVLLGWLRVIGTDAWVGLSLLQALFWVVLGVGLALVARLPGWPVWAAGVWVLTEALRSVIPWGGFPWGRLAHALVEAPLVGYVHLGGVSAVTAAGAAAGTLLAGLVLAARQRDRRRGLGAVVLTGALVGLGAVIAALVGPPAPVGSATVAVVQGNVPRAGLDFAGQREAVLSNHVEATLGLAEDVEAGRQPAPDVVLWPENSSDIDPFVNPDARARIDAAVAAVEVPTLVGVLVGTPDGEQVQNLAVVWDPVTGPGQTYAKRHPVPFGEYVPAREFLVPVIGRFDRVPRDMLPGTEPGVLTVGPTVAGVVICFEIAYDPEVRDVVAEGGEYIVVQTNNATYGRTGQPDQQFAISRLRALEHGRDVFIASTSGISGIIRADGTVVAATEEFVQEVLVDQVDRREEVVWATMIGPVAGWALAGVGALGIGLGAARHRGARDEPQPLAPSPRGQQAT